MNTENYITLNLTQPGLCVRMYLIISYLNYARDNNKKLLCLWRKNNQCPGNFSEVFKGIDDVVFLENDFKGIKGEYPKGKNSWNMIDGYWPSKYHKDYSLFKPTVKLQDKIDSIVNKLGDFISLHVRRTDMPGLASNSDFFEFIDELPDFKIYLACDQKSTQETFLEKYGERIFLNKPFKKEWSPQDKLERSSSLEDAVIDLFVASRAKFYKGSNKSQNGIGLSSFSGAIQYLYNLNHYLKRY